MGVSENVLMEQHMNVNDLEDLFVHDLEDIYYAENELLDALDELAEQTQHDRLAEAFRDHREETQGHVERLDRVFEMLEREPEEEECEGIQGLIDEHEEFVESDPDQQVLDVHNIVAGQKTEHYEIAAYANLTILANQLGMDEAASLLHETLTEEEAALDELTTLAEEFDYGEVLESASD
jgi:ferritin-like metal-binding protein YciE